ncbi:hypothetical protein PI466_002605 [Acinetobacter baumannii]|nr:hypothetical protein [Acinetobacter baumannii]
MNLFISKTMFTLNAFKIVIYRQFIIFTLFIFRHLKSYPIRFLTPEEKALAQRVFGSLLDCERPKIIATRYIPWQAHGILMAPNGNIYVNLSDYSSNYALESKFIQGIFIHELAHVMQYQRGIHVLLKGALLQSAYYLSFKYYNPYKYTYHPQKAFSSYNIEQQGEIARDICSGKLPNIICLPQLDL